MWENLNTDLLYAEMKSENFLDRVTSAANPRFIERVVKGSRFNLEMIYGVYQVDGVNDLDYFAHVVTALAPARRWQLGRQRQPRLRPDTPEDGRSCFPEWTRLLRR